MSLVEVDGCIFDEQQLVLSHSFEALDPVTREAFVNHLHISGDDRQAVADQFIRSWAVEMHSRWPDRTFQIYRQTEPSKVIIRFHMVRLGIPNWCEAGLEIIEVSARSIDSPVTENRT
jgi:hypothetical protein